MPKIFQGPLNVLFAVFAIAGCLALTNIAIASASGAEFKDSSSDINDMSALCEAGDIVSERTNSCLENRNFAMAARKCLQRLDELEHREGNKIIAVALNSKLGQEEAYGTGALNFLSTIETLKNLRRISADMKNRFLEYQKKLVYPDGEALLDFARPSDLQRHAMQSRCFGTIDKKLLRWRQELQRKINRYEKRIKESERFAAEAAANQKRIQNDN